LDFWGALTSFARVVELGNYSRAAQALGMSTSRVSAQVQELERHFGTPLLTRTTRRMNLTDEGRAVYQRASQWLAECSEIEEDFASSGDHLVGTLRVNLPSFVGRQFVVPHLPEFAKAHPQLRVILDFEDRIVDVIASKADIVLRLGELADSSLVSRRLASSTYVACASPAYLKQRGVPQSPEALVEHDALLHANANTGRARPWQFEVPGVGEQAARSVDIEPPFKLRLGSVDSLIELAQADMGIIYVLNIFVAKQIAAGQLVPLFQNCSTPTRELWAVYPKEQRGRKKVQLFVDFLATVFAR
jgi:LysR family transcriptional regulator, regulator for bpeEF and oprC